MEITLTGGYLQLARRQNLYLTDCTGIAVTCLAGGLWITQERDLRDVVLSAGETFTLDRPGLAIVHAHEESSLRLEEPARAGSPAADWWQALRQRLGPGKAALMPSGWAGAA